MISLDRPAALNAVDSRMTDELGAAIDLLERSDDLLVGVLTGTGRAFCVGADMKAVASGSPFDALRHPEWGFAGMATRRLDKPLVAAVNGAAIGGGLEIALCCDVIVAADDALLGLPEVRHGVFAAGGGVQRLARRVPLSTALELMLTGRLIPASEAMHLGLVNRVAPRDDVLAEAVGIASEIAANASLAVRASKRLAWEGGDITDSEVKRRTDQIARDVFASRDAAEGMAAFADGRSPTFTGD
ncbi:enoyl-CoA hydratase/isomerase family protein [Cnuibacter physcomitrellae]|uniref:enoyl-CoA hydratase/isomerase family protein n=1 Tax=Cnuibacter physcomitrellae TaxID=1619308 RepID=UPI001E36FD61|nr:enoyl-CoA hydratase-related protein [Cnuibacter physcomitrellae]